MLLRCLTGTIDKITNDRLERVKDRVRLHMITSTLIQ